MVCMAPSMASGNILLSPSLQLPKSPGMQVSASMLQGAVNSSWKVGEKSARHLTCTPTVIRRKARNSPSVLVRNEAADHEAEPKADLQLGGERDEGYSTKESAMLHRREIILATTATLSYLSSARIVQAAGDPVPPTNFALKDCRLANINGPQKTENCCLPDGSTQLAKPFGFEDLPMRIRKPAHILSKDPEYVKKYNEAYSKMKDLPDDDPRSFKYQWRIHCAFCTEPGAYPEPGNVNGLGLQYHGGWSFLPWHRMYLYFHERILGELINDPSFALPFWNWDNQRQEDHGNQMPLMFTEDRGLQNNHLRDAIRNLDHYPPAYVILGGTPQDASYERIRSDNLSVVHTGVVSATSAFDFLGGAYRPNQSQWPDSAGNAETDVHNSVHNWTGSDDLSRYPNNEDMGTFAYAARDPIFYSHHSNVDRLWSVWQGLDPSLDEATRSRSRARQDPTDAGFRQTKFAFYDHKGELVEVKTEDTLDTKRLKYEYEVLDSDQDWINFQKRPSGAPKPSQEDIEPFSRRSKVISKDQSSSFQLLRRKPTGEDVPEGLAEDEVEETLVVKGCKLPMNSFTLFKVFINLPDADADTPLDIQEFTGLITHIPHPGPSSMPMNVDLRVSSGACLRSLGIEDEEAVSVTFVAGGQQLEDVYFDDFSVEFS